MPARVLPMLPMTCRRFYAKLGSAAACENYAALLFACARAGATHFALKAVADHRWPAASARHCPRRCGSARPPAHVPLLRGCPRLQTLTWFMAARSTQTCSSATSGGPATTASGRDGRLPAAWRPWCSLPRSACCAHCALPPPGDTLLHPRSMYTGGPASDPWVATGTNTLLYLQGEITPCD